MILFFLYFFLHCLSPETHFQEIVPFLEIDISKNVDISDLSVAIENAEWNVAFCLLNTMTSLKKNKNECRSLLHLAVKSSLCFPQHVICNPLGEKYSTDVISLLIDKGIEVNQKTKTGNTALHLAVRKSDVNVVSLLIDRGSLIDEYSPRGNTPLHLAVVRSDVHILSLLINKGADVNKFSKNGCTALHLAIEQKSSDKIIYQLLFSGADIHVKNASQESCFYLLLRNGYWKVLDFLKEQRVDYNAQNSYGETLLHQVILKNQFNLVLFLLKQDIFIDQQDHLGQTPLFLAGLKKEWKIVKKLLQSGASVGAFLEGQNETFLNSAVESNQWDVVLQLIQSGIDCDIYYLDGEPLLHVMMNKEQFNIVQAMIKRGFQVESLNLKNQTPLFCAIRASQWDIVLDLIRQGVHCDLYFMNRPLLHLTMLLGQYEVAREMIKKGIQLKASSLLNHVSENTMDFAMRTKKWDIVLNLIDAGCDCEVPFLNEEPFLFYMIRLGHFEIVQALIDRGFQFNFDQMNFFNHLSDRKKTFLLGSLRQLIVWNTQLRTLLFKEERFIYLFTRFSSVQDVFNEICIYFDNETRSEYQLLTLKRFFSYLIQFKKCDKDLFSFIVQSFMRLGQLEFFLDYLFSLDSSFQSQILREVVDVVDGQGNSILHFMVSHSYSLQSIQHLIFHNADLSLKNKQDLTPLYLACHQQNDDVIRYLIHQGALEKELEKNNQTVLHTAVWKDNLEMVQFLVENRWVSVSQKDGQGRTPLYLSATLGHLEIVEFFLQKGVFDQDLLLNQETVLHRALESKEIHVFKLFLSDEFLFQGVNLHALNFECQNVFEGSLQKNSSQTSLLLWNASQKLGQPYDLPSHNQLLWAYRHNNLSMVNFILGLGVDSSCLYPYLSDSFFKNSCRSGYLYNYRCFLQQCDLRFLKKDQILIDIVSQGHVNLVNELLQDSSPFFIEDLKEKIFLLAIEYNQVNIVETLICHGVNIYYENEEGDFPLLIACRLNSLELIHLLLKNGGVDVNKINDKGQFPLYFLCQKASLSTVQLLFENGAEVPLECQAILIQESWNRKAYDVVNFLMTQGFKGDSIKTFINELVLWTSCRCGYQEIVRFIIQYRCDLLFKENKSQENTLIIAIRYEQTEIVRLLMDAVNFCFDGMEDSLNPLFLACRLGCVEILQLLIQFQINLKQVNKQGQNVLEISLNGSHLSCVDVLLPFFQNDLSRKESESLIILSCIKGHIPMLLSILDHHPDLLYLKTSDLKTLLHLSCDNGHRELCSLLIEKGILYETSFLYKNGSLSSLIRQLFYFIDQGDQENVSQLLCCFSYDQILFLLDQYMTSHNLNFNSLLNIFDDPIQEDYFSLCEIFEISPQKDRDLDLKMLSSSIFIQGLFKDQSLWFCLPQVFHSDYYQKHLKVDVEKLEDLKWKTPYDVFSFAKDLFFQKKGLSEVRKKNQFPSCLNRYRFYKNKREFNRILLNEEISERKNEVMLISDMVRFYQHLYYFYIQQMTVDELNTLLIDGELLLLKCRTAVLSWLCHLSSFPLKEDQLNLSEYLCFLSYLHRRDVVDLISYENVTQFRQSSHYSLSLEIHYRRFILHYATQKQLAVCSSAEESLYQGQENFSKNLLKEGEFESLFYSRYTLHHFLFHYLIPVLSMSVSSADISSKGASSLSGYVGTFRSFLLNTLSDVLPVDSEGELFSLGSFLQALTLEKSSLLCHISSLNQSPLRVSLSYFKEVFA